MRVCVGRGEGGYVCGGYYPCVEINGPDENTERQPKNPKPPPRFSTVFDNTLDLVR
jgi:hypothetical protein